MPEEGVGEEKAKGVLEKGKVVLGNYENQRIEGGGVKVALRKPLEAFVVILAKGR